MSIKQMVILSVVVVALVFIVTFASQYLGSEPKQSSGNPKSVVPVKYLKFPQGTTYGPADETAKDAQPPIHERSLAGHHDYWFENDSGVPVKLGVVSKSCKCSKVEVCVLPEEKWKGVAESQRASLAQSAEWKTLLEAQQERDSATIPAGGAGWLRLAWDGEKQGRERLTATLWIEGPSGRTTEELAAEILFLDPVVCQEEDKVQNPGIALIRLDEKYVGKVGGAEVGKASFICWSATRPDFTLQPDPDSRPHPCIIVNQPEKLSAASCEELAKKINLPVRTAYRLAIEVREQVERIDEKTGQPRIYQLDQGLFRYPVHLKSSAGPVTVHLMGEVEGPVIVETPDGRSRIDLGSFPMSEDRVEIIKLYTSEPDLEVRLDGERTRATPFFQVKEPKEIPQPRGKAWHVELTIPANTAEGPFPNRSKTAKPGYDDCAVYLTIHKKGEAGEKPDQPVRRIRIPIYGNATR